MATIKPEFAKDFLAGSALLEDAYETALEAHHGPRRNGDTEIDHPLAVARLLNEDSFPEPVIAAALLHDVVEDTDTRQIEVEAEFGAEVADLVAVMTEDDSISSYRDRKAEHRGRVVKSRPAAAIYAADKLAKVRALNQKGESPPPEKLEHYRQTLVDLRQVDPPLPFLADLAVELDRLS